MFTGDGRHRTGRGTRSCPSIHALLEFTRQLIQTTDNKEQHMQNYLQLEQKILGPITEQLKADQPDADPFVVVPALTLLGALTLYLRFQWLIVDAEDHIAPEGSSITREDVVAWLTRRDIERHANFVHRAFTQIEAACADDVVVITAVTAVTTELA
jgi:hypothetical protein